MFRLPRCTAPTANLFSRSFACTNARAREVLERTYRQRPRVHSPSSSLQRSEPPAPRPQIKGKHDHGSTSLVAWSALRQQPSRARSSCISLGPMSARGCVVGGKGCDV
eukprot:1175418-Prorocentrum_minimum.AAC.2